jgi:hypothetical protein
LGDLFAEVVFFIFEQGFRVALFEAPDEEAKKTFDEIGETTEHELGLGCRESGRPWRILQAATKRKKAGNCKGNPERGQEGGDSLMKVSSLIGDFGKWPVDC